MNIFLTGAGGFSGTRVAAALLEKGHVIYGLCRSTSPAIESFGESSRMVVIRGDLAQIDALPTGIDAIVHTAATSAGDGTPIDRLIHDNVVATSNLVKLAVASGVKKFCYFSSISVYGDVFVGELDENAPIINPGAYGVTKLLGEFSLRERAEFFSSLAVRLPAVVGRGASRHWLSTVLAKAKRGDDIRIYNPTARFNNAVHVGKLAALIGQWLDQPREGLDIVNVASTGAMEIREIVDFVRRHIMSRSRVIEEPVPRPSFVISSRRAYERYRFEADDMQTTLRLYLEEESR